MERTNAIWSIDSATVYLSKIPTQLVEEFLKIRNASHVKIFSLEMLILPYHSVS